MCIINLFSAPSPLLIPGDTPVIHNIPLYIIPRFVWSVGEGVGGDATDVCEEQQPWESKHKNYYGIYAISPLAVVLRIRLSALLPEPTHTHAAALLH